MGSLGIITTCLTLETEEVTRITGESFVTWSTTDTMSLCRKEDVMTEGASPGLTSRICIEPTLADCTIGLDARSISGALTNRTVASACGWTMSVD